MRWLCLAMMTVLPRSSAAVPPGWFDRAAGGITLGPTGGAAQVDVPLLLAAGDPRPRVEVHVEEDEPVAAIVDVGHGPVRIGAVLCARLGLSVRNTTWRGEPVRVTRIRWLRAGDLVLHDVHAEVVSGEELVLGAAVLDGLAVAVLRSEGVVRFVPPSAAEALLEAVSAPMNATASPRIPGLGLPVTVTPSQGAPVEGVARLRSDRNRSTVVQLGHEELRGGAPAVFARVALPTTDLPAAWLSVVDPSDPSPEGVGTLGADLLATVDVAVSGATGRVAVSAAETPTWTDLAPVRLSWVERQAAGWDEPELDPEPTSDPAGDPGDLLARLRWSALAEAQWAAGRVEATLRSDALLARVAGDHCEPWLVRGEHQLAVGRATRAADSFQRAAELYEAWERLSPDQRSRVRRGRRLDPDTFAIPQPASCEVALARWMEAALAAGDVDLVETLLARDPALDPGPPLVLAVALAPREPVRAEALLREALARGARLDATTRVHLGSLVAARGAHQPARATLSLLSGLDDPHPFATAVRVVELARLLDPESDGVALLDALLRSDPAWIELSLAAEAMGLALTEARSADALAVARARRPGDPALACLTGLADVVDLPSMAAPAPPHPDCLVARIVAAGVDSGTGRRLLEALEGRWPLVPRPGGLDALSRRRPARRDDDSPAPDR